MTALIFGTLLALAALSYVLYPLLAGTATPEPAEAMAAPLMTAEVRRSQSIEALREIEFDRETGKLSDGDYASLKASCMQEAVNAMRAGPAPICPNCGPRPESSAKFCSSCGSPVPG